MALAFGAIAALHVLAALIGWYGYDRIQSQQRLLRTELLPLSSASQRVAASMARLALLTDMISIQQAPDALQGLVSHIERLIVSVEADLQPQSSSSVQFKALSDQFVVLELGIRNSVLAQQAAIERAQIFDIEQRRVLALTDEIALKLETLDPGLLGLRLSRDELQEAQRAVTSWHLDLMSVPRLNDSSAIETVRLGLTRHLRYMVRLLSQVPSLLPESGLSQQLFELLNSATQPNGVLSLRSELIIAQAQVQAAISAVDRQSVQFASSLDVLVARRNNDAAQASVELQQALKNSELALYAASLLALLLSVLFTKLLVFRQVVTPLAGLTQRTAALAAGDISSPVPPQNHEELSDIAGSLRVFQRRLLQLAETEEQLRLQNQRLNAANGELDRFAYAASHDLRSPLRGARTLVGFIREDYEGAMPQAICGHMERLDERLVKMESLLQDLLAYSRAGSESEESELIALRPMVEDALEVVSGSESVSLRFELEREEFWLPPTVIKQVVRNLLDNAVKYGFSESSQCVDIVFRGYAQGSSAVFEIEDSGRGIPTAYRERVLELFQSLETNVRKTSSGIGLAMVQRLLSRYDGSLTLLSASSGSGALARVTLPLTNSGLDAGNTWPERNSANGSG